MTAQVRGRVVENSAAGEPLPGASVYWAGTGIGVSADSDGAFSLGLVRGYDRLVASYVGYEPDTVTVTSAGEIVFRLDPVSVGEVVVSASNRGNYTALDGILKGEVISFSGLTKMACCNLAESFENSASVTVGYSDAVTGTRQIKMLGLAGIYTQILDESRPIMRGLGSPYGLGYVPGMWLEGIQLSKGITSVTGGHEAIAGQINLEFRKPTDESPLFVNVYADQDLRAELNVATAHKMTDKLSHIMLAHTSVNPLKQDHNGDGFIDSPVGKQFNLMNRFLYVADNGIQMRLGVKYLNDKRQSGQKGYEPYTDRTVFDPYALYGSEIANENAGGYFKLAIPLGRYVWNEETNEAERSNLAFVADYDHFGSDSYFGQMKDYRGKQNLFSLNAMYSWNISPRHKLVSGLSARSDNYKEFLRDGMMTGTDGVNYLKFTTSGKIEHSENELGAYAEYSYNYRDRFTAIAGVRGDYSDMHGFFATPRGHIRWAIAPRLVLRLSSGLGYRSANIITDNLWALATGRLLVVEGNYPLYDGMYGYLNTQESSFTSGGSLTWNFRLGHDENASLGFDYFHTRFGNQLIADQEYNSNFVNFYDSDGLAYSNTYQVDFNWAPATGFDILLTFRYNGTAVTLDRPDGTRVTVEKPLTDRYKGLINLQYATRFRRWVFDFTAQVNGPMRIPGQDGAVSEDYSDPYPMFYAQVTRRLGVRTSVYLGCENIGGFMQDAPVVWQWNVHNTSFNSSLVWGPLMGRKIYLGARITF